MFFFEEEEALLILSGETTTIGDMPKFMNSRLRILFLALELEFK